MEPYYEHAGVTIYHGDCREVLAALQCELVVADPPYNYGMNYGSLTDDSRPPQDYEDWCAEWFHLARHISRRQVVFCGSGNIGLWYRVHKPSAVGCWFKPGNGASSIIGFEDWEPWLYWHGGDKGLLGGPSVIRQPLDTSGNETAARAGHPCPKPVNLLKQLLKKCRADEVLDPFLGSGTTLIAAKHLGIPGIGIEIEECFCELAAKRLSQEVFDFAGGASWATNEFAIVER